MQYRNTRRAVFIKRPNRFTAHVLLDGKEEIDHVKNTGRCKEILKKGANVILERAENKNRKTKYSMITAYKNDLLINIDSQVPNQVVAEALAKGKFLKDTVLIKREFNYGNSRFDIYFENKKGKGLIEVKGVTLEDNGVAKFPDAPTERGTRHLREMIKAVEEGYSGYIFFLIQLKGAKYFTPNHSTDPLFASTLSLARDKGVKILAYDCLISEDSIELNNKIPVRL
ncbi:MAG: DNA/RNA nuclease SfsA [Halanaerobiaceae bacterium]|nr:DNA/RNA nuclease SfsA [Halanaerobiaceae bacterium]